MEGETPAARAIRLLDVKRIAHACNLTTDAVYKWSYRQGGRIPSRYQSLVLQLARDLNVDLTAEQVVGMAA